MYLCWAEPNNVENGGAKPGFQFHCSLNPDMDALYERFDGFYRYAKVLENIARGIEAGDIRVP